jgi:hypothetical protein
MSENTYQGFTRAALAKRIIYDPVKGIFLNTKTKEQLDVIKGNRHGIVLRVGFSVVTLAPSKVAFFLQEGTLVKKGQIVRFKDKNSSNYSFDNLYIHDKDFGCKEGFIHPYTTPTQYDRINLLHPNMVYVVIRGPEQAVYRTPDYDKAVSILTEWMKDNTIHRWDMTMPDEYLPQGAIR